MSPTTSAAAPPDKDGATAYLTAGGAILGSSLLGLVASPLATIEDLALIHVAGIVILSLACSVPLSLGAAIVMISSFAYLFVPPRFAFAASELDHAVTFGMMLLVAGLVSGLGRRLRQRERAAHEARLRSEVSAEAERMRSSLLSSVSHDLKAPLASILAASTTLLERRAELDDQAEGELLAAIVSETERLSHLVHDLLSVTRFESGALVLPKSAESIEEIASVAVERLRTRGVAHSIRSKFDPGLPLVLVDPILIEQVLLNLMTNAVRYAGPAAPVELSATKVADHLLVRVSDRGPGVPEADRERVFDKFYRGPNAAATDGGLGLGLSICRAVVNAHGGLIAITEREGGGACVEFTLPVASAAEQPGVG